MSHTVRSLAWMTSIASRDDGIDLQMRGVQPQDFTAQFGRRLRGVRIGHRPLDDAGPIEPEVRDRYHEALEVLTSAGAELARYDYRTMPMCAPRA